MLVSDLAATMLLVLVGVFAGSLLVAAAARLLSRRSPCRATSWERLTPRVSRRLVAWCAVGFTAPVLFAGPVQAHDGGHLTPPCALPCDRLSATLTGLPLPDLPVGGPGSEHAASAANKEAKVARVVVRPGDSLWLIAVRLLPPNAATSDVAALTDRIYLLNRTTIGRNRDLIHPGMPLVAPKEMS